VRDKPYFTVVIPSLNASGTVERTLRSIRGQEFDQDDVEVLLVDGGSTDDTREIAARYGCRVVENPRVQQEYAKHVGLLEARGHVALYIDADECLANPGALARTRRVFDEHPSYRFVMSGGYRKPEGASAINDYINMFSDPFAYFMTGVGGQEDLFRDCWKRRYETIEDNDLFTGFRIGARDILPTVDLCAGNAIDADYAKTELAGEIEDPMVIPRMFYFLMDRTKRVAMLKDDPIVHYSADRLRTYVKKLGWRVKVNVHYREMPGTGFSNREVYQGGIARFKKYLFVPYGLTVVAPLAQAIRVWRRTGRAIALIHPALCFYVALDICWQFALKAAGRRPELKTYGAGEQKLDLEQADEHS
jgi:glycosyltransferase involved in cell wall biosynthesis